MWKQLHVIWFIFSNTCQTPLPVSLSSSAGLFCISSYRRFVIRQMMIANTLFRTVCYHPEEFQIITSGTDRKVCVLGLRILFPHYWVQFCIFRSIWAGSGLNIISFQSNYKQINRIKQGIGILIASKLCFMHFCTWTQMMVFLCSLAGSLILTVFAQ